MWYDDWDDPEDERQDYDCGHGCNGDCVALGYDNGQCGITCHPGLKYDPREAARLGSLVQVIDSMRGSMADLYCCYFDLECSDSSPDDGLEDGHDVGLE